MSCYLLRTSSERSSIFRRVGGAQIAWPAAAQAPKSACARWEGSDYSSIVLNPEAPPAQDYIVFTYDDYQSGQANGPYPQPPNHIVSIREERYKLAKYYDADHGEPDQWEMYDLATDPLEVTNIAFPSHNRTPQEEAELARLLERLEKVQAHRLRPGIYREIQSS